MQSVPAVYATVVSARMRLGDHDLAARWLARLEDLIPVSPESIFPTSDLLDHIPTLIKEIGEFLAAPDEDIAANTFVMAKARELGMLRHHQRASAHQLLREYEVLRSILHAFVLEETERLELTPSASDVIRFIKRIDQAIGILATVTVDTFIQAYSDTINDQTRRLEAFNRMASHELRQPLGVLQMAARMLRVTESSADKREQVVTAIERNVTRLIELVETITRLSRGRAADGANADPGVQAVCVGTIAGEAARQIREMADARQVEIRISPDFPSVTVDVGQLALILTNLLSNAIKYSDPAKSERFAEVAPVQADGGCSFQVRDNGLGMTPEQLRNVFVPFYRGHVSAAEGIGLGLAIVRDCAEGMGGSVSVDSVQGHGTTFTVILPDRACTRLDTANPLIH